MFAMTLTDELMIIICFVLCMLYLGVGFAIDCPTRLEPLLGFSS
jgi:hypothetical protein